MPYNPVTQKNTELSYAELQEVFSGITIQLVSRSSLLKSMNKFDFTWFIPSIIKYRKLFRDVLIASLFIQTLALITPLFFQVVMDKVLVHRGLTTLNVIAIGLISVSVFQVILGGLRTYIFSHTTSRIDVELGAKLFRHLLSLPLSYFEHRQVGSSIARVRELENIRNFLTGSALTVFLDLLFSFLFILVMFFYSWQLTLIVLCSIPCYVIN